MRNLTRHIILCAVALATALALAGCDKYDISGFFHSPSETVNKRFAQSMEINASHTDTLISVNSNRYSVYVCSDVHVKTTADNLGKLIDFAQADTNTACNIILGDITDQKGGLQIAYDTIKAHRAAGLRLFTVAGNHDLYFNQWEEYKKFFGSSSYHIAIQTPDTADLFVFLDSGNGTLGRNQYRWLVSLLESRRQSYRHCFVATHTNFFDIEMGQIPTGSFTLEETASLTSLFSESNVTMVLNGHDHHHEISHFGTTPYLTIGPAMDGNPESGYVVLTVGNEATYTHHLFNNRQ